MKPIEDSSQAPHSTGTFARGRGFLGGKGIGAPIVLLLALGVLALAPGTALAAGAHGFEGTTLGSGAGEGAGQLQLVAPIHSDREETPRWRVAGSGVAVNDQSHDVYVADTGNHRVSEFESNGTFLRTFGKGVNKGNALEPNVCGALEECQKGGSGSAPGELQAPRSVAVDNSSGESRGDVYVGDGVGSEAATGVQDLNQNGVTSATYTLTFEDPGTHTKETTGDISLVEERGTGNGAVKGKDAEAAQQALEALPGLAGNVTVGHVYSGFFKIEFIGGMADKLIAPLEVSIKSVEPAGTNLEVVVEREGSAFVGEVISKFTPEGALIGTWGDATPPDGQLTGVGAEDGPFAGQLDGIAVDCSGDLWVDAGNSNGSHYKYEFEQDGTFMLGSTSGLPEGGSAAGIAVNCEGKLYAEPYGEPATGLALDTATNELYTDLGSSIEHGGEAFGSAQLAAGGGAGIAVDASANEPPFSDTVYAANTVADVVDVFPLLFSAETKPAGEVAASGMTLHGTVDPEGSELSECYFEFGTSSEYEHTVECEPKPGVIGAGTSEVPVQAKVTGLRGGTTYHFRVVAKRGAKVIAGVDLSASTPMVPVIAGAEAPKLTTSVNGKGELELSAELHATVNPEGLQVSYCAFEYGTSVSYGQSARCVPSASSIGEESEPVAVRATISKLAPDTTYHWRLRVEDANGEAYGADHTFVYPTVNTELPDHRAYEMVSPPFKNGALVGNVFIGLQYDFSEDGSRVIAGSTQCFAGSVGCTAVRGGHEGDPFEFTRTPSGWVTTPLAPPATEFSENDLRLVSPEEGTALFSMPTPPGGEDDWYARSLEGAFADIGPLSPPSAGPTFLENATVLLPDATADLSHVVWEEKDQWPFASGEQVLEYAGTCGARAECEAAKPFLVGVDNEGKPIGECGTFLGGEAGEDIGQNEEKYALSADGRTVYFTACGAIYARVDGEQPGAAHTVTVSAPQCGAKAALAEVECRLAPPGDAAFRGASADGSRAFFLDTAQLTDDATQGTGKHDPEGSECSHGSDCNLYESQCTKECEQAGEQRSLIDVSAGDTSGVGPQVQGVVAVSADGSHVYFVANGTLAPGARPGHCSEEKGMCNLYVYERDAQYPDGRIAFIASVPGTDSYNWTLSRLEANVTPEGRFLVFKSFGVLTPDDTRTNGYTQVFRYDADQTAQEASEHIPALARVSIGEDGYNDDGNAGVGNASIVPVNVLSRFQAGPIRRDPTMSNNGSYVFFQSPVALTPNALNDAVAVITEAESGNGAAPAQTIYAKNVYEWEAPGTVLDGHVACVQASGCTYLISDGRDTSATGEGSPCALHEWSGIQGTPSITSFFASDVCLLGTDGEGRNVFFTTSDQLVPADTDTQGDIYDARICESGSPCIQPAPQPLPPCIGEQCHGIPPARSSQLTGGSETFNGAVNPAPAAAPPKKVTKKTTKCKKVVVKKKGERKTECLAKKSGKKAKRSAHKSAKARK